jgi:hypothetical protein
MAPLGDANVILVGEQRWLTFGTSPPVHHRLTATYRDLGNTKYTSVVAVNFEFGTKGSTDAEGNFVPGTLNQSSFGPVSLTNS